MGLVVKDGNGANVILPAYDTAYSAGVVGYVPLAAPTDMFLVKGSSSKIVRLKKMTIAGQASATGDLKLSLVKRSDAGTLGSAVLTTLAPTVFDSAGNAASAVVSSVGTANMSAVGTLVGSVIRAGFLYLNDSSGGWPESELVWDFSDKLDQAPVLRGVTEFFAVNGNAGIVPPSTSLIFTVQLEEGSI